MSNSTSNKRSGIKSAADSITKLKPSADAPLFKLGMEAAAMTAGNRNWNGGERRGLLRRANDTINGDRQRDYGDKLQNFSQIAMLWQGLLATKLQPNAAIFPEDVALLMIAVKMARLAKSPDHEDSILDVAGYAGCYSLLQSERKADKELLGATKDPRAVPF